MSHERQTAELEEARYVNYGQMEWNSQSNTAKIVIKRSKNHDQTVKIMTRHRISRSNTAKIVIKWSKNLDQTVKITTRHRENHDQTQQKLWINGAKITIRQWKSWPDTEKITIKHSKIMIKRSKDHD
jgi:hypothetical protein